MARRLYNNYQDTDEINKIEGVRKPDVVYIEHKVSGISLAQDLHLAGVPVNKFNPNRYGDKIKRVRIVSHLIEGGRVWVLGAAPSYQKPTPAASLLIEECATFPNGEYRDLIDTMTQVLIVLGGSGWVKNPDDPDPDLYVQKKQKSRSTIY
jgi:predicted phage terminase large subunit-like protein